MMAHGGGPKRREASGDPKKMLINLTPHTVSLHLPNGETVNIPPSGDVARIKTETHSESVDPFYLEGPEGLSEIHINIAEARLGDPEGLPPRGQWNIYIVATIVAQQCPHRDDLVTPADFVRDDSGKIIGCRQLLRWGSSARAEPNAALGSYGHGKVDW